jgi:drug/metabolite transporter (DMT)-like permease
MLMLAYGAGDLSQIYPIARGTAPVGVVLVTLALDPVLPAPLVVAGVLAVSMGIVSLAWRRRAAPSAGRLRPPGLPGGPGGWWDGWRATAYALACGVLICGYTVLDSRGVRLAGSPLAYGGWIFLFYGLPWVGLALARRGWRRGWRLLRPEPRHWILAVVAGGLCFSGYVIAVWALSRGAAAPVSALRETSVIFAALIGTLLLKEPFGRRRLAAAALVALGVVLIRIG